MLNKRQSNIRLIVMGLIMALTSQVVSWSPPPFYQQQEAIEKIVDDPKKSKDEIVAKLIAIAEETENDIHLRIFAAQELGKLRAIQTKNRLKSLAEKLEWNDAERYLKRATTRAYWEIRIAEEATSEKQEALLITLLSDENHPSPHADVIWDWAADELANKGVKEALPEIIGAIRSHYSGERSEVHIWLCSTKIELLTTSSTRQAALFKALLVKDATQYLRLKKWAIQELGKLNTEESRLTLVLYALGLQNKYWEEDGKRIINKDDRLSGEAGEICRNIIDILRDAGMTDDQMKALGINLRNFIVPGWA